MGQFSQFTKAHNCKTVSLILPTPEPHLQATRSVLKSCAQGHVLPHIKTYHTHSLSFYIVAWPMAFSVTEVLRHPADMCVHLRVELRKGINLIDQPNHPRDITPRKDLQP